MPYSVADWQAPSINTVSARDLYPETQTLSLTEQGGSGLDWTSMSGGFSEVDAGGVGAAQSPVLTASSPSLGPDAANATGQPGGANAGGPWHAKPTTWIIVLIIFVALIMFTAHKTGKEGEFSTIRASGYNIAFVGLVAMVFFLVFKSIVGATGLKKSGFGTAVLAA